MGMEVHSRYFVYSQEQIQLGQAIVQEKPVESGRTRSEFEVEEPQNVHGSGTSMDVGGRSSFEGAWE